MEEKLRVSEEKYRALYSAIMDPVVVAKSDTGIIMECNQAAERFFGYSREELIGMHQNELHPPEMSEDGALTAEFIAHITDPQQETTTPVITSDGTVYMMQVKSGLFEISGRSALVGIFHDVTEQLETEAVLRESEHRHRIIFENSPWA